MAISNTSRSFGSITKSFHWLTALLILTAIPLGIVANQLPVTPDALPTKAWLFSLHKTVGVSAFLVGALRILWALGQTRPDQLHSDRRLESFLAQLVHWLLYISLVIVPLSGWLHHAATEGFAPILWPFGQSLPLVPKSPEVAEFFAAWHFVFTKILALSVLLHIAGALKHHVIDRDDTLRRMWFGTTEAAGTHGHSARPAILAFLIYAVAMAGGSALGLSTRQDPAETRIPLTETQSGWQVETGTLSITVRQLGTDVTGSFADWTAAIDFDDVTKSGSVDVTIAIATLTLGTVTDQALGPDFFDASGFPTAQFSGPITSEGDQYRIDGLLTLKGVEAPVPMAFELDITGDMATAAGTAQIDRRTFGIGQTYTDESSVGFPVQVTIELTARRAN